MRSVVALLVVSLAFSGCIEQIGAFIDYLESQQEADGAVDVEQGEEVPPRPQPEQPQRGPDLKVDVIQGIRDSTEETALQYLHYFVALRPGSDEVDLSQVRIQVSTGRQLQTFEFTPEPSPFQGHYAAQANRDADGSFTSQDPIMTPGDLVRINVTLVPDGMALRVREDVQSSLIPEDGESEQVAFRTPSSYGTRLVVMLY